jgi:hypothetical protein
MFSSMARGMALGVGSGCAMSSWAADTACSRGFLELAPAIKPGYEAVLYTVRMRSSAPREKLEELHRWIMKTSPNHSNFATAIRMIPNLIIDNS